MLSIIGTIGTAAAHAFGAAKLWSIAHAPELLLGARVVATGAGIVAVCKATTRAGEILNDYEKDEKHLEAQVAAIKEKQKLYLMMKESDPKALEKEMAKPGNERHVEPPEIYTEQNHKRDLVKIKQKFIFRMVKNYALAVGLFGGALFFDLLGYRIMSNRITALAVAYTSLDNCFKAYQARVKQVLGEEGEAKVRLGGPAPVQIEAATVDGEEQVTEVVDQEPLEMPWTIEIKENSPYWCKDWVYMTDHLATEQASLRELLMLRRFLTWNEVCCTLDPNYIPTKQGEMFGWSLAGMDKMDILNICDEEFFSLGIEEAREEAKRTGSTTWVLRPNVQGFIYADIPDDEGIKYYDQKGIFSRACNKVKDKVATAVGWKKVNA